MAAPESGPSEARDLQPTRIFLADMVLIASVDPGDERMTDILQRGGDLRVVPAGANPADPANWVEVAVSEIMMVVPPPHVSPPEKRVERQRYEVRVRVGEWELRGTAHLKPGAEQDAMLRVTQPFLPLTHVTMTSGGGAVIEAYDVVIVHLKHAEFIAD